MVAETHHTEEQIAAAFAKAPGILQQLTEAGLPYPRFTLYVDGSGTLHLSDSDVTKRQWDLAVSLVHSQRRSFLADGVAIDFCCGLVHGA